jgi:hypothetical protein
MKRNWGIRDEVWSGFSHDDAATGRILFREVIRPEGSG